MGILLLGAACTIETIPTRYVGYCRESSSQSIDEMRMADDLLCEPGQQLVCVDEEERRIVDPDSQRIADKESLCEMPGP